MTLAKPRDRRVVGNLMSSDNAKGHVLLTRSLDRARRPDPARVRVEQQRDHHRRLKRRPAVPVLPVGGVERAQIHLRHRVEHEPRKVRLRQPVADVGRQQKRLLAAGRMKVLAHARNRLNSPGRILYATATMQTRTTKVMPRTSGTHLLSRFQANVAEFRMGRSLGTNRRHTPTRDRISIRSCIRGAAVGTGLPLLS
jgi:hypothetical protein